MVGQHRLLPRPVQDSGPDVTAGLTGSDDPFVAFYHDVPRALARESDEQGALPNPTTRL